jgi:outer membrane protein assembly factor BamB
MSIKKLILVSLAGLLISACSSNDEKQLPPAELVDFKAEMSVKTVWSQSVGSGQGDIFNRLEPFIDGDKIYAAGSDGTVVSLNKNNGKKYWSKDLDTSISGGVAVASGRLYVSATDGSIIAMSADDGRQLWRVNVGSEVLSPVAGNDDVTVVLTLDGRMLGLNATSGENLWEFNSTNPVLTMRATSTPMIIGNVAVGAFASGKVVALDVDSGKLRWDRRVAIPKGRSELERIVDIDGSMLYKNDLIYATSYQGNTMAIEPSNGRVIWQTETSSYTGVGAGFGNVYIADENGTVIAMSEANGDVVWERAELARRRLSDPAAFSSYLAVGDFEGYVHFLSQIDGHMVGRTSVDSSGIRVPMLVDGGMLYVFGNSGRLEALKIK